MYKKILSPFSESACRHSLYQFMMVCIWGLPQYRKDITLNKSAFHSIEFPHIGQRMIKTAVAVFICLLIYRMLGFEGATMPAEAVITAIICMQPFIRGSRNFAFNRFFGTLFGAVWGLIFLVILYEFPIFTQNFVALYAAMAVGALLSVYTAVLFKIPDTSCLSAIVFICIVISFPDIDAPHIVVAKRFLGVLIGTAVAIGVNYAHLPREKRRDRVFFVRARDLTPNRFSRVPSLVLFHMNHLYEDGAQICIILEHAPAFFTLQMSACHLSVPLIVMDGAGIFDTNINRYLYVETIPREHSAWLQSWLRSLGISFFTYTVHNHRTCVFHDGTLNEQELLVLKHLQRSPYRSYLDDDRLLQEEIVYFKVIAKDAKLQEVHDALVPLLRMHGLRMVIHSQASTPGVSGLYIYSEEATWEHAGDLLMEMLRAANPEEDLHPVCIFSKNGQYSENSAASLLHKLKNAYEPVKIWKIRGSK